MTRTYARSVKGNRAYGIRPYHRGKNVTLIGAMSLSGFNGAMTIEGGTSGNVFRVYLEKILLPTLKPGSVVVMDNLPAHKVSGIQELIESVGARIVYLSPYSPEFNPIENCWSKIKEFLRSAQARSREALDKAIATAIETISKPDIRNWFSHCCYCTSSA